MLRILILSAAIVLAVHQSAEAGPGTKISVVGKLNGGTTVSASVLVSGPGQVSGAGNFAGTNPANGYKFSYPFTVNNLRTAPGQIILTGNLVAAPTVPVTLTATVPNGPVTFTYVINGKSISYTGTGIVTIQ